MARARNIKPAFFTNELLGTEDPMVSLTFVGLWCLADKVGILEDRPLRIKAELFPYRESLDVNGYLTVLARLGFIVRYENEGRRFIQVCNFRKHQSPHNTEKGKGFPFSTDPKSLILGDNGYVTVKTQCIDGGLTEVERPDSLIPDTGFIDSLIPDSLIEDLPQNGRSPGGEAKAPRAKILKARDLVELGVSQQHADDWLAVRKQKRAPLTESAFAATVREAGIAGITLAEAVRICAERGWQGFKAEWLASKSMNGQIVNRQQQVEDANARVVREIMARESGVDLGGVIAIDGEVIHVS